jgi:uncharacterized SAM-dependent methyltransferase
MAAPGYDLEFLKDSVALLQGTRSSHMGVHQYADHGAMRGNMPMSGALGWNRYETNCPSYYIIRCENELLPRVMADTAGLVPRGTPFVDFGPGNAKKSLIVVEALDSATYAPIDRSATYRREAGFKVQQLKPGIEVVSSGQDFFSPYAEAILDDPGLGVLPASTIGNIEGRLSKLPPAPQLRSALKSLARITGGGRILLTTDPNQDEEEVKRMYAENGLFEVNTLDRMAYELPISGLYPDEFDYDPYWIPESSQLGHTAVARKTMHVRVVSDFFTGTIPILGETRVHFKNSFKFPDEFFVSEAQAANVPVVEKWTHPLKPSTYWLLDASAPEFAPKPRQGPGIGFAPAPRATRRAVPA